MKMRFRHLIVRTRRTIERIEFSEVVTFLYGPVSTGKSTVARLLDYCLGGNLERTPAIQQEFIAAELSVAIGDYACTIERAAADTQNIRVTWIGKDGEMGSVNAPLEEQSKPLLEPTVYNFSDLIFYLAGVEPIKVRRRYRDPDSPLVRLSIRDVWWYCYLEQAHLDSSFFRLEEPFRGRKSQDAMRFFTGLHSERLSQLESELMRVIDEQRTKREAVQQIRSFMARFELESETDLIDQLQAAEQALAMVEIERAGLEHTRMAQMHPTDSLRQNLRSLSAEVSALQQTLIDSKTAIAQQVALRAELITAKAKAERICKARAILEVVPYQCCPECGRILPQKLHNDDQCCLCGGSATDDDNENVMELELLRQDLNERIDQISDSVDRRKHEYRRTLKHLEGAEKRKANLDRQLEEMLARYDSSYVETVRLKEREIATLVERIRSLKRFRKIPQEIDGLQKEAGALQGRIDQLRNAVNEERGVLSAADAKVGEIAAELKRIMLAVSFPGVTNEDRVVLDPRNWKPVVLHGDQEWTFWDTGSGGKKTLFNVCYALALHTAALEHGMPVPSILIIDSPTKNISEYENPELVRSLYEEIYRIARCQHEHGLQFLLVDSELVQPNTELPGFLERRMAGTSNAPRLIPYYEGP